MNRIFEDFFPSQRGRERSGQNYLLTGDWTPAVDIYEDEDAIILKADIPGVDPESIDIRIEGNTLIIRGERNFEKETKRENFYRVERSYGSFVRAFTLPYSIQADKIEARYENGVLIAKLPKSESAKPRQIKVNMSGQSSQQVNTQQENRQGHENRGQDRGQNR
jgi:HSP20 family protein